MADQLNAADKELYRRRIDEISKADLVHNCAREVKKMHAQVDELNDAIAERDSRIDELTKQGKLDQDVADRLIRQARNEAQSTVDEANAKAQATIEQARAEANETLKKANATLVSAQKQAKQQLDDAAATVKQKLTDADGQATDLINSRIASVQDDIDRLSSTRDTTKTDVTDALTNTLTVVDDCQQQLTTYDARLTSIRTSIASALATVDTGDFASYQTAESRQEDDDRYQDDDINVINSVISDQSQPSQEANGVGTSVPSNDGYQQNGSWNDANAYQQPQTYPYEAQQQPQQYQYAQPQQDDGDFGGMVPSQPQDMGFNDVQQQGYRDDSSFDPDAAQSFTSDFTSDGNGGQDFQMDDADFDDDFSFQDDDATSTGAQPYQQQQQPPYRQYPQQPYAQDEDSDRNEQPEQQDDDQPEIVIPKKKRGKKSGHWF